MNEEKYHFSIDSQGKFSFNTTITPIVSEEIGDMNSYCMEHTIAEANNLNGYYIFKCFGVPITEEKFRITFYAFQISCIFLILTIAIYVVLNEIRKVFGKILVLYCFAMLLESATLAYTASEKTRTTSECQALGK